MGDAVVSGVPEATIEGVGGWMGQVVVGRAESIIE